MTRGFWKNALLVVCSLIIWYVVGIAVLAAFAHFGDSEVAFYLLAELLLPVLGL